MLPSRVDIEGIDAASVRSFVELVLSPVSLAIIADAVDLGLFERLAAGPCATAELAAALDVDADAVRLEVLLELGAGLDLLRREDGLLRLSPMSEDFLTQRSRLRLLGLVDHYRAYLPGAASVGDALRRTQRARRSMWRPGAKREDHERYFAARQAYNESRRRYFSDTAWLLLRAHLGHDLASRRVACDIGSGPGAFACLLRKAFPQLRAIAIDTSFAFDEYRQRSEAMLAEEGVEVELRASNALLDPLPDDVDLITFNRLLSGIPREGAGAWLDRAFDALAPGGVFAAADMFMSGVASHDRHVAAVIGLWMGRDRHVLDTDPPTSPDDDRHQWGWSRPWHAAELEALLRARGFVDTFSSPADPPFTLVGGRKP